MLGFTFIFCFDEEHLCYDEECIFEDLATVGSNVDRHADRQEDS